MSIASVLASALGMKRKHEGVVKYETDLAFFKSLRAQIEAEQDKKKKAALLRQALISLRDQGREVVAKMAFAGLVSDPAEWDGVVVRYADAIARALEKDEFAGEFSRNTWQRATDRLRLLISSLDSLATNWESEEDRQKPWQEYLKQKRVVDEALVIWRAVAAERNESKKQQLRARLWPHAMDESLASIIRLEMIEPKNPVVAEWKILAQKLAKGEAVASGLKACEQTIDRALPKKLQEFAKATFGMTVAA